MAVPPHDDDEETLEELDLDDAALVSQQSAAHAPVPRANVDVVQPSIVLADDLNDAVPPQSAPVRRRGKRSLEPTLVIRDRRQIEELRRLRHQQTRKAQKSSARSILLWGFLGLLAFGLGGAIALFAAKNRAQGITLAPDDEAYVPQQPEQSAPRPPDSGERFIDLDAPIP